MVASCRVAKIMGKEQTRTRTGEGEREREREDVHLHLERQMFVWESTSSLAKGDV